MKGWRENCFLKIVDTQRGINNTPCFLLFLLLHTLESWFSIVQRLLDVFSARSKQPRGSWTDRNMTAKERWWRKKWGVASFPPRTTLTYPCFLLSLLLVWGWMSIELWKGKGTSASWEADVLVMPMTKDGIDLRCISSASMMCTWAKICDICSSMQWTILSDFETCFDNVFCCLRKHRTTRTCSFLTIAVCLPHIQPPIVTHNHAQLSTRVAFPGGGSVSTPQCPMK